MHTDTHTQMQARTYTQRACSCTDAQIVAHILECKNTHELNRHRGGSDLNMYVHINVCMHMI